MRLADTTRNVRQELNPRFWPPPELFDSAPIHKAVAEVRDQADQAEEARRVAVESGHAVEAAEQNDLAAEALAHRDGKPRPKPSAPAAEKKAKEAEHEAAVIERAAVDAAKDAASAREEYGQALAEKLVAKRDKQAEAMIAALDQVATCQQEIETTRALLAWVSAPELQPWRPGKFALGQVRLPRTSDHPMFRDVLAGLRKEAEALLPQPEPKVVEPQPLRAHPLAGAR